MYKTNRVNHDFQIVYFLAGACHTPDAAYAQMCDLEDDRVMALNAAKASALRLKAAHIRIAKALKSDDEAVVLEAQADLMEHEDGLELSNRNLAAAEAELATIRKVKEKLEPLRQYAHLPLAEAHQAAQTEEWRLHLLWTAQNMMLSTGTVAHDYLGTMRMHPEFKTGILPSLDVMRRELIDVHHKGGPLACLSFIKEPSYNVAALIEGRTEVPDTEPALEAPAAPEPRAVPDYSPK